MTKETPVDTPAMVRHCLACPWPWCWDCLGKKNEYSRALRQELEEVLDD